MTSEAVMLVPLRLTGEERRLLRDIRSAAARAHKADAGDRGDLARYESLCVRLEKIAEYHAVTTAEFYDLEPEDATRIASHAGLTVAGGPDATAAADSLLSALSGQAAAQTEQWLAEGLIVVAVNDPFRGGAAATEAGGSPPPPAERWHAEDGSQGKKAVIRRFRDQLERATEQVEVEHRPRFTPSGINNQVLTEVLRDFVRGSPTQATHVGVEYRDGSQSSHPFPLRSLQLADDAPASSDLELRLALLSIRHTEMDIEVDGAWLRNSEVSKPRPAALTDDLVYETSRRQFRELTRSGTRTAAIRLFQTGLDAAIVGFYRSVVEHLTEYPGSLTVIPMFYAGSSPSRSVTDEFPDFRAGEPWTTTGATHS